ncbi:MAG: methylmalonyl-CoA decarboxylase [Candidatus Nanopelagicales bacterium]
MSQIAVSRAGFVTTLTMDNSQRRNVLGSEMVASLQEALSRAAGDGTRVVVLRATQGSTTWSAGHDITDLPPADDPLSWTAPQELLFRAVSRAPLPVIAAVEGGVWGGACDLVACCDLVIATPDVTFAITPARLGVPYNIAGVSHFVDSLPLHIVKEMFFTAQPIDVTVAHQHGLVNRVLRPDQDLSIVVDELAQHIATLAPLVIRAIKAELGALGDGRPLAPEVYQRLTSHRRAAWTSADYKEGVAAFRERRKPEFTGQ